MRDPHVILAELQAARSAYNEIANIAPAPVLREKHEVVKQLERELSTTISADANQCPDCGSFPHGMIQDTDKFGRIFEVGCLSCSWFRIEGEDVARDHGAQGMMPRHAVEAWNAGPRYWKQKKPGGPSLSAEQFEALPTVKA